jgi:hypothetical protein
VGGAVEGEHRSLAVNSLAELLASPAWSSSGSPVKICFIRSGSLVSTWVPKISVRTVKRSPYCAAARSMNVWPERSSEIVWKSAGQRGPGGKDMCPLLG